ncbi:hypothetical protein HZC07_00775 [Candidatus Micrarchaeota archaeon]|nr:hypothetical protein [Candidatus Micrarchaeota archaeon]
MNQRAVQKVVHELSNVEENAHDKRTKIRKAVLSGRSVLNGFLYAKKHKRPSQTAWSAMCGDWRTVDLRKAEFERILKMLKPIEREIVENVLGLMEDIKIVKEQLYAQERESEDRYQSPGAELHQTDRNKPEVLIELGFGHEFDHPSVDPKEGRRNRQEERNHTKESEEELEITHVEIRIVAREIAQDGTVQKRMRRIAELLDNNGSGMEIAHTSGERTAERSEEVELDRLSAQVHKVTEQSAQNTSIGATIARATTNGAIGSLITQQITGSPQTGRTDMEEESVTWTVPESGAQNNQIVSSPAGSSVQTAIVVNTNNTPKSEKMEAAQPEQLGIEGSESSAPIIEGIQKTVKPIKGSVEGAQTDDGISTHLILASESKPSIRLKRAAAAAEPKN